MQEQYNNLKQQHADAVLLFRLGDFYEAFYNDAETLARVLGITLTGRGKGDARYPMAGIPYHALQNYLPKLIRAGIKVAIAEQTEEPKPGQLVDRQVTKIITSGTILDETTLDETANNYLGVLWINTESSLPQYHFAFADVSTGQFEVFATNNARTIKEEIERIDPAELLCAAEQELLCKQITARTLTPRPDAQFEQQTAYKNLVRHFKVHSLEGFGLQAHDRVVGPAGALLLYLQETQKSPLQHMHRLRRYQHDQYMHLDQATIRNLELLHPLHQFGSDQATVYGVLNHCKNPLGKRLLRQWLVRPLVDESLIVDRHEVVAFFYARPIDLETVRDHLANMPDIERIASRLGTLSVHPKALRALGEGLRSGLALHAAVYELEDTLPDLLLRMLDAIDIDTLKRMMQKITQAIQEDAPSVTHEGGIFQDGYDETIDSLRTIRRDTKSLLARLQQQEIEKTGIASLKVSYNKVFGYYFEVTHTHKDKVPDYFVRKQTLANAERFITDELKQLENDIFSAEEKLLAREQSLYLAVREEIAQSVGTIIRAAQSFAALDVLANFAHLARERKYVQPTISSDNTTTLDCTGGRHVVVEHLTEPFVSNETCFTTQESIHILTGPNMSGKSTYIRQVALLVLLAQVGSFVPAEQMNWQVVDRIFTRVGASDNLAQGSSTFMVEMIETANILQHATGNSLVILDEVGRGTSTFDGVAIAWSIVEYLHDSVGCQTLFATHYHELLALADRLPHIVNYHVAVAEEGDAGIVFTHEIKPGGTSQSYGIHVGELAGLPKVVTQRAQAILEQFETSTVSSDKEKQSASKKSLNKGNEVIPKPKKVFPEQMELL